ncbi:unnamed protein product [Protopolystoma xenopodis]|uniref:Uncharacterized protein n=1 Tax=Protopolystoma xenopodis TaxID=117903 RepID=A0A3S5B1M9_9PLAT|nr:unnamed protein product [Protopolystoma xenopodis]
MWSNLALKVETQPDDLWKRLRLFEGSDVAKSALQSRRQTRGRGTCSQSRLREPRPFRPVAYRISVNRPLPGHTAATQGSSPPSGWCKHQLASYTPLHPSAPSCLYNHLFLFSPKQPFRRQSVRISVATSVEGSSHISHRTLCLTS